MSPGQAPMSTGIPGTRLVPVPLPDPELPSAALSVLRPRMAAAAPSATTRPQSPPPPASASGSCASRPSLPPPPPHPSASSPSGAPTSSRYVTALLPRPAAFAAQAGLSAELPARRGVGSPKSGRRHLQSLPQIHTAPEGPCRCPQSSILFLYAHKGLPVVALTLSLQSSLSSAAHTHPPCRLPLS